jgi:spermidine/putrescine transport system permease protein
MLKRSYRYSSSYLSSFSKELFLTLPSFLWLFLFFLIPTLIVAIYSFKTSNIYGGIGKEWTLENFYSLFQPSYVVIFWRTIVLSTITTIICLILALPISYYMATTTQRIRQLVLLLVIIPFWSSFLVRIFAWKSLLHPEGYLKQFLVFLHIVSPEATLLYHPGTVLLVMVYTYLPFAIIPLYAAATKFQFQLFEAALDLGATRTQAFFKVFIPGINKGILTAIIMVIIPAMGAYVIPELVGGTQSEMIGNKIAQRVFTDRNLPQASMLSTALCFIFLIPMLIGVYIQGKSERSLIKSGERA